MACSCEKHRQNQVDENLQGEVWRDRILMHLGVFVIRVCYEENKVKENQR